MLTRPCPELTLWQSIERLPCIRLVSLSNRVWLLGVVARRLRWLTRWRRKRWRGWVHGTVADVQARTITSSLMWCNDGAVMVIQAGERQWWQLMQALSEFLGAIPASTSAEVVVSCGGSVEHDGSCEEEGEVRVQVLMRVSRLVLHQWRLS